MDALFQSRYERTPKFYREIYFYNYFKRPFSIIAILFMGLLLVVNLFFSINSSWKDIMSDIAVGIGIVFFVLYFLSYPLVLHLARKRDDEANAKADTKIYTLSVTQDKIISLSPSGIEIEVRYAKIPKIYQSRNYIMFITDDSMIYAMPKKNFTVGTYDGLIQFLRSKNYQV